MNSSLVINSIILPEVNKREVRRYLHAENTSEINLLIDKCTEISMSAIEPRVCYSIYDIKVDKADVSADGFRFSSSDLCCCLKNCDKMVMFCATIGFGFDRLIRKYEAFDKATAVCLHALGAERIEALCDEFCRLISEEFQKSSCRITPRFSPGYGDLPLDIQREIFSSLECTKRIGVSLGDNLFMTPTKSVTAVVGFNEDREEGKTGCALCGKTDCQIRKQI